MPKFIVVYHDEWIRNVLVNRPDLKQSQLERTKDLMNKSIRDCLVTKYEHLIPSLTLPDKNDRHVLAAAIKSSASIILTYNLKDFPLKILRKFNIQALHPDSFLSLLIDIGPEIVCNAIRQLRSTLKNPPMNVRQYLNTLDKQMLTISVRKLEPFSDLL